jgi:hypothetical protein
MMSLDLVCATTIVNPLPAPDGHRRRRADARCARVELQPFSRFYRAPVQAAANGGVLVIDDFGRQHCSPRDLLNRWIVPLESRVDYSPCNPGRSLRCRSW